jgi:hypothetical protein
MRNDTQSAHLSQEYRSQLSKLVGRNFWCLYAAPFEINTRDTIICSFWVGIPIDDHHIIIIKNEDYFVTRYVFLNYYSISIQLRSWYNNTPHEESWSFMHIVKENSISQLRLKSIEIYELRADDENMRGDIDTVIYDKALVFCREEGLRICLRLEDSIAAKFEILINKDQINSGLSGLVLRETIS